MLAFSLCADGCELLRVGRGPACARCRMYVCMLHIHYTLAKARAARRKGGHGWCGAGRLYARRGLSTSAIEARPHVAASIRLAALSMLVACMYYAGQTRGFDAHCLSHSLRVVATVCTPGSTAPECVPPTCPKGQYLSGTTCTSCGGGFTTPGNGSTSAASCTGACA